MISATLHSLLSATGRLLSIKAIRILWVRAHWSASDASDESEYFGGVMVCAHGNASDESEYFGGVMVCAHWSASDASDD
jgi:hypothetical protein